MNALQRLAGGTPFVPFDLSGGRSFVFFEGAEVLNLHW